MACKGGWQRTRGSVTAEAPKNGDRFSMVSMRSEGLFRLLQGLIFVGFVFHRTYYNRKYPPDTDATVEAQPEGGLARVANLLALPAFVGLALYLFSFWARWAGVLVAALGFALLEWSHRALGRNWSDHPRITESQTLVTSGPYRWIRHPIYTAFLLILGSPLLISANGFIGGLWITLTALDVRGRIRFEEERMQARFGEAYESYLSETGLHLPRFWS